MLQAKNEKPVSKSDAWDYATLIGAQYIESSSRANVSILLSIAFGVAGVYIEWPYNFDNQ